MRHASFFFLGAAALLAGGCASAIVGGECESGYAVCHSVCVDLNHDPFNCGACGITCTAGAPVCSGGTCVADAGVVDGSVEGGFDAGPRDMGVDMPGEDAGYHRPPCNIGEILCAGVCVPATRDIHHCGGCGTDCPPGDVCAAGMCQPICMAPLMHCGDECIDTTSDPDNCGMCGNVCATGICLDSACSMGRVGHVVLVGHDYASSIANENLVIGNAVLISVARPIRLLTFPGSARAMAVAGADSAVDGVAMTRGASIVRMSATTVDEIPLRLASADVFLLYAQRDAIDPDLTSEGMSWSAALSDFVARGGVVVVLDDDSAVNQGTWQVLTSAGLLTNTSRTVISGTNVHVVAAGDQVATGLSPIYRGQTATVRFDSTDAVKVIDDGMGNPVVIHRTVTP